MPVLPKDHEVHVSSCSWKKDTTAQVWQQPASTFVSVPGKAGPWHTDGYVALKAGMLANSL